MKKGILGLDIRFYAIVAFVLVIVDQSLFAGLLLGFVLLVEKDEWVSRQCMQALFLRFLGSILRSIFYTLGSIAFSVPVVGGVLGNIVSFISSAISFGIVVMAIVGIVNVMKGKDAGLPLLSGWAARAFGVLPAPPVPSYQPMQAGAYNPAQAAPVQNAPQPAPTYPAAPPMQAGAAPQQAPPAQPPTGAGPQQ